MINDGVVKVAVLYDLAKAKAQYPYEIPSNEWLDSWLRECGCPQDQLEIWRNCIKNMQIVSV